jgi:hypothetical protein
MQMPVIPRVRNHGRQEKRRERDSNPCYGYKPVERFSKPSPSAARPSLLTRQHIIALIRHRQCNWVAHLTAEEALAEGLCSMAPYGRLGSNAIRRIAGGRGSRNFESWAKALKMLDLRFVDRMWLRSSSTYFTPSSNNPSSEIRVRPNPASAFCCANARWLAPHLPKHPSPENRAGCLCLQAGEGFGSILGIWSK